MKKIDLGLRGPVLLDPDVFRDDRGFFMESWNRRTFAEVVGEDVEFVQDNHSRSFSGVLRGVHYQLPPHAQGKLVRVTRGSVWDLAVDLRRSSPTFKKWVGVELTEDNALQLWIPLGFGHGFLTLSEVADVLYKSSAHYAPDVDRCLRWDDPEMAIDWPLDGRQPTVSERDAGGATLAEAALFD
ncbi:MAG: dTDP-4-dehydrorhamnose 3,5-epimerase [Acidimicrobiia bacterium]